MTDLEMIKLCWKAITGLENDLDPAYVYDPLHDDAQAMQLVKKLGLGISPMAASELGWGCCWWNGDNVKSEIVVQNIDLNRAIVECVAKM